MSLLDWINLDEFFPLVVLICLLWFIGGQMTQPGSEPYRWARRVGAVALLLYAGFGIHAWSPAEPSDFIVIVVRAMLAYGLTLGLSMIVLSILVFAYEHFRREQRIPPPEPPAVLTEPPMEVEQAADPVEPLPKPTPEELADEARQRYDEKLQLIEKANLDETERRSASERAKQQYLHELDDVMS